MKSLINVINEGFAEHGEIYVDKERNFGFVTWDENSGTVICVSADKAKDLAIRYGCEEEYFDPWFDLKVGQSYEERSSSAVTYRIF